MRRFTTVFDRNAVPHMIRSNRWNDEYRIGDTVKWSISSLYPGHGDLLDGAYEIGNPNGTDDTSQWLLIVDHKIVGFIARGQETDTEVETQLRIRPYERSWWSHTLWRQNELDDAKANMESAQRNLKWAQEDLECTDEEKHQKVMRRLGEWIGGHIWDRLGEEGFARKVMNIKKLDQKP